MSYIVTVAWWPVTQQLSQSMKVNRRTSTSKSPPYVVAGWWCSASRRQFTYFFPLSSQSLARAIFPNIPIELVVSCGTGAFLEEKSAPQFGWNGIIGQFVNSATDSEMTHHILEDMLGQEGGTNKLGRTPVSSTQYYRFNPVVGAKGDFPVDEVDEEKLEELSQIASAYMREPEQARKLRALVEILNGGRGCKKLLSRLRRKR